MNLCNNVRRMGLSVAVLTGALLVSGCTGQPSVITSAKPAKGGPGSIGVVILVDTSGSMRDTVSDKDGKKRPKYQLANEALTEILRQTGGWTREHPDQTFNLSISSFSDKSRPVMALAPFDSAAAQMAVKAIPSPDGGTAIGLALQDAWAALKPVQCERQYILCVTDGENNKPPHPRDVVPTIFKESDGKVEIHFIAFDVNGSIFDFAKPYNGHVVSAANKEQLDAELKRIFQDRILLEQK